MTKNKLTLQECREISINIWQYIVYHKLYSKAGLPSIMRGHFDHDCPFCEYIKQISGRCYPDCPLNAGSGTGSCVKFFYWLKGDIKKAKAILNDLYKLDTKKWEEKVYGEFSSVRKRK